MTTQARLKLYRHLDPLWDQVLYHDTDSVIFSCKPGQTTTTFGDYLGDMTSKLNEDDYITEFVLGSAKNYGYLTKQGKSCCKVRRFTLNYRGSWYLNYEVMKQNVLEEITDPLDKEWRTVPVTHPYFFARFFMHAGILGVPDVGISSWVSWGAQSHLAVSSSVSLPCVWVNFFTISSVMALSSDSASAKPAVGRVGISLDRFLNYLRSCNNSLDCCSIRHLWIVYNNKLFGSNTTCFV